jgi:hypothetical protein
MIQIIIIMRKLPDYYKAHNPEDEECADIDAEEFSSPISAGLRILPVVKSHVIHHEDHEPQGDPKSATISGPQGQKKACSEHSHSDERAEGQENWCAYEVNVPERVDLARLLTDAIVRETG